MSTCAATLYVTPDSTVGAKEEEASLDYNACGVWRANQEARCEEAIKLRAPIKAFDLVWRPTIDQQLAVEQPKQAAVPEKQCHCVFVVGATVRLQDQVLMKEIV
uniref:Uncharacterized protein n=1 Tax=Anopheles albimanus TaxID=7167 RepID=A0A182FAL1_ANOAL